MKAHYQAKRGISGLAGDYEITSGKMLAGGKWQDIEETSAIQNFEIGTRLKIDDRVFHYAKFHTAVGELTYGLVNGNVIPTDGAEVLTDGNGKVGDKTLVVLDTGSSTTRPKDYYKGGYCLIYRNPALAQSATNHDQFRRIIGSTVGNTVSITLTLDFPLTVVPAATVDCYPSIYSCVGIPGHFSSGEETFVGFAHAVIGAGEYGWIQTWGPVNAHYNVKFPGEVGPPGDRECYFNDSGEVITPKQSGSDSYVSRQRAGYVLPCTKSAYGSEFIMLQLMP